jgi:hypothetical protein
MTVLKLLELCPERNSLFSRSEFLNLILTIDKDVENK